MPKPTATGAPFGDQEDEVSEFLRDWRRKEAARPSRLEDEQDFHAWLREMASKGAVVNYEDEPDDLDLELPPVVTDLDWPPRGRPASDPNQPFFAGFGDLLQYRYRDTPCDVDPANCEPRKIKHVVWDADDTLWDVLPYGIASSVNPPCRRVTTEEIACGAPPADRTVRLKDGVAETMAELKRMGIGSSVASFNTPGSVEYLLKVMGRIRDFDVLFVDNAPDKGTMVEIIAEKMGITPEEVLFLDDDLMNVADVKSTGALALNMGRDIQNARQILKYIKE